MDFRPSLEAALLALLPLALGLMAVVGAFQVYVRRYERGGILCIAAGILAILVNGGVVEAVLVILAGVLALILASRR